MADSTEKLCTRCGTVGVPTSNKPHPAMFALPMVGAAIVAGLMRARSRRGWWLPLVVVGTRVAAMGARQRRWHFEKCAACGSRDVIPLDTPVARERLRKTPGETS